MLEKLLLMESLGIKYIVMYKDIVAVKEKDREKMLEIINVPNNKIMRVAGFAAQKELEEIRDESDRLTKKPENSEALDILARREKRLRTVREDYIPLEHITKGVEIAYNMQKEEYLDEGEWMMIG